MPAKAAMNRIPIKSKETPVSPRRNDLSRLMNQNLMFQELLSNTPNLMHGITFAGKTLMVPLPIDDLKIKFKAQSGFGIVPGEEFDILCILTIFGGVGASTGAHKLFGFCVVGDPLKSCP